MTKSEITTLLGEKRDDQAKKGLRVMMGFSGEFSNGADLFLPLLAEAVYHLPHDTNLCANGFVFHKRCPKCQLIQKIKEM